MSQKSAESGTFWDIGTFGILLSVGRRGRFMFHETNFSPNVSETSTVGSASSEIKKWCALGRRGARETAQRPNDTSIRPRRSEEHTSELQSLAYLVCR